MNVEAEIHALSAETLALSITLGNVLSKLATVGPGFRNAIAEGFDQSADVAQTIAEHFGKSASPEHTIKAMRIIEELRTTVLGNEGNPRKLV